MGGSSKPAPAKPTPFVEPPAPRNPVPNWFQGRAAAQPAPYTPPQMPARGAFGAMGQPMPGTQPLGQQQIDPQQLQALMALLAQRGLLGGGNNGQ